MSRHLDPAANDAPVALGTAIIALIEPHDGYEAEFDRWYERDHMRSCGACAPHTFAVTRYVGVMEPRRRLAMYWIEAGHHDEQSAWVAARLPGLTEAGRMFPHRDHIATSAHDFLGACVAEVPGVPVELALDRRYPTVALFWIDADDPVSLPEMVGTVLDALDEVVGTAAVEMGLVFTPRANPDSWPDSIPQPAGLGSRLAVVCFADQVVHQVWPDAFEPFLERLAKAEGASVSLASPFTLVRPGDV